LSVEAHGFHASSISASKWFFYREIARIVDQGERIDPPMSTPTRERALGYVVVPVHE
jgi:hypothetical protein